MTAAWARKRTGLQMPSGWPDRLDQ